MTEVILTENGIEAVIEIPYGPDTEKLFRENTVQFSIGPYPIGPMTRAKNILEEVSPVKFDSQVIPYLDHN